MITWHLGCEEFTLIFKCNHVLYMVIFNPCMLAYADVVCFEMSCGHLIFFAGIFSGVVSLLIQVRVSVYIFNFKIYDHFDVNEYPFCYVFVLAIINISGRLH